MGDALHTHGGVVSAAEARLADAGLLALSGPGALDVRAGVLHGPGSTNVLAPTADTGPMTVAVNPHHWVTSRGSANGPYRGALDAQVKVPIAAAPGSGTRIDVVYVKQSDAATDVPTPDATTAPVYGVLQGTVGGGKPSLAPIVGAEELGTVTVTPQATATSGAGVTIANTARQTVPRGVPIPVRSQDERDALTGWPGLEVRRLDVTGTPIERWITGTTWRRELRGPVVLGGDVGIGGAQNAPGPITMHPSRTIDPAALFGAGVGAVVHIDARVLSDCPAGQWALDIVSPALSATVLARDSRQYAGRNTLFVTDTVTIPAGTTRSFSTRIAAGTGTLTTYGDVSNNRCKYTVHPYV